MNKILVICGPTATGKTSLAIKLAKKFSGEIISADSRQVYKGMDVGTGKDVEIFNFSRFHRGSSAKPGQFSIFKLNNRRVGYYAKNGVKIWGLDLVEPSERFSVAHWMRFAKKIIEDIWQRGKLPLIVGGTGFYIKGLLEGYETLGISPDYQLRKKLSNYPIAKLSNLLKKLNCERLRRMNESDRKNPRRLIRAIEIATSRHGITTKKAIAKFVDKFEVLMIGLRADYKTLYQRIDKRVEKRIKQGAVKELQGLLKKGCSWDNSVLGETIGYKEWRSFFEEKAAFEDVVQKWKYDEHNYARRQMTWFKKTLRQIRQAHCEQAQGEWFDIDKKGWQNEIEKKVENWFV